MSSDASFGRFVQHCFEQDVLGQTSPMPSLTQDEIEALHDQKLAPTYLQLVRSLDPTQAPAPAVLATARHKLKAHAELAARLQSVADGPVVAIKGPRFSKRYPPRLMRESRDLDLMVRDEADFIRACATLSGNGFDTMFFWLVGTPRGLAASAKFMRTLEVPGHAADKVYVELHLRSFPVTPYSTLYFFEDVARLSPAAQDVAMLLAEFVYRDGKWKRFTGRDLLDVAFLFPSVDRTEWPALEALIAHNALEPGVLLLADHWRAHVDCPMPGLLEALAPRLEVARWEGEYDFIDDQAWPACERRGMDRATFEAMASLNEALYVDENAEPQSLDPATLGFWLGIGMPVAARLRDPSATRLMGVGGACELLSTLNSG